MIGFSFFESRIKRQDLGGMKGARGQGRNTVQRRKPRWLADHLGPRKVCKDKWEGKGCYLQAAWEPGTMTIKGPLQRTDYTLAKEQKALRRDHEPD